MYYSVNFKTGNVFCGNIAKANSIDAVREHYGRKYEWYAIEVATERMVKTAKRKGMPIIDLTK